MAFTFTAMTPLWDLQYLDKSITTRTGDSTQNNRVAVAKAAFVINYDCQLHAVLGMWTKSLSAIENGSIYLLTAKIYPYVIEGMPYNDLDLFKPMIAGDIIHYGKVDVNFVTTPTSTRHPRSRYRLPHPQ